jgi:hypothetical protein
MFRKIDLSPLYDGARRSETNECWNISAAVANKDVLGFIDASREIRRPALVGMQFLHQGTVSASDVLHGRSGLNPKNLISLLFCHFAPARWAAAVGRSGITWRVFTPAGLPPVKISGE